MLLFNGSLHNRGNSFYNDIYNFLLDQCEQSKLSLEQFDLSGITVPHYNPYAQSTPKVVYDMLDLFTEEDIQIWLAPLYHGGIPGVMKNALDWIQLTNREAKPYLSDTKIGLICIADGGFAIQGINAMTSIAHTLRAWVLPYTVPINKSEAQIRNPDHLASYYQSKIEMIVRLLEKEGLDDQ
ncbi:MAG TPA: NAD(P)H-dependent oxidoreductase [Balneolaceae bacterium]|nr:NAD(P)H-dependent oxidoreductase [Balneolaceae bacterium]